MNELVFVILVLVGQGENILDFKSPKVLFPSADACEKGRQEMIGSQPEILKRSSCMQVVPAQKKTPETEKTVTKCVRPPSAGFAAGKPCAEA